MMDTKSTIQNRKHTLLHYLIDLIDKEFPQIIGFHKELDALEPASKGINCEINVFNRYSWDSSN